MPLKRITRPLGWSTRLKVGPYALGHSTGHFRGITGFSWPIPVARHMLFRAPWLQAWSKVTRLRPPSIARRPGSILSRKFGSRGAD